MHSPSRSATAFLFLAVFLLLATCCIAAHGQNPAADAAGTLPHTVPASAIFNPMLDEMWSRPAAERNQPDGIPVQANSSPVNPNFGGFRVAPSTPAHKSGDTSRDLSSVEGDFNQDGCKDIVTFQVSSLTLMAGDCHGHFKNINSQSTALNVYHPVAVDLNHDGYPDIVAMTAPFSYSGTVVVLINQKNGTFAPPVVISKKASVYSGLMGFNVYDINGDGNPDVIITGLGTQDTMTNSSLVFEVIFGNPDGTFNTSTLVETDGTIPYKPTLAYDGGTTMRVINGQLYLYGLFMQAQRINDVNFVSELLYRWTVSASGVIGVANPQVTDLNIFSSVPNKYIRFADLNGDGIPDFTLLNGDGMLYTAIGAQDGSFGPLQMALPVYAGNNAAVVTFQDFDGDGKVDAILAGGAYVGVWPGNGDGTFRAPKETYLAGYADNANSGLVFPVSNHIIDDFDGDGILDIAFFDTPKRDLCFYKGKPDGTFIGAQDLVSTTGNFPSNGLPILATPDLNGDGFKDIIVSSPYGILSGINDGHGNFTYRILSPLVTITSISSSTADFNGDGKDDVVFFSVDQNGYRHMYIGLSNGDGTITAVPQVLPFTSTSSPGIAIGDINGDGIPDIALALNNYTAPASYGAWPMINDGKGNLKAGTYVNAGTTLYGIALADTNGDHRADLLLSYGAYAKTTTAVFLTDSTGNFAAFPTSIIQNTLPGGSILAQDVTGDGIPDALVSITNGTSEGLLLYVGNGDGTFQSGIPLVTGIVPYSVGAADLNGDGYPDIFFTSTEAVLTDAADSMQGLVVLRGTGNNGFAAPQNFSIYGASAPLFAVDLVHNGSPSILAANGSGTTVLLNNGASVLTLSASATTFTTTTPAIATVRVAPYYSDQPAATGTVSLKVDGVVKSTAALTVNAIATLSLSGLSAGTHTLSATYSGDANYNVNLNSNTVSISVTKATPAFTLSASSTTVSMPQTGSGSVGIALAANNAFSGPVGLTCTGAPIGSTCSFTQSNVTLAPGQTVTSTLTLSSTTTALNRPARHMPGVASGVMLCCLLGITPLFRRRRGIKALFILAVAAIVGTGIVGCSSSGNKLQPGTYALTVTAYPGDTTVATQAVSIVVTVSK